MEGLCPLWIIREHSPKEIKWLPRSSGLQVRNNCTATTKDSKSQKACVFPHCNYSKCLPRSCLPQLNTKKFLGFCRISSLPQANHSVISMAFRGKVVQLISRPSYRILIHQSALHPIHDLCLPAKHHKL